MYLWTLLCAVSLLAASQRSGQAEASGPLLTHFPHVNCTVNYIFLVHDVHAFVRRSPWLQYFRHSGRDTHAFINGQRMQHEHSAVAAHAVPKLSANHSSSVSLLNVLATVFSATSPSTSASTSTSAPASTSTSASASATTASRSAVYVVLPEDSLPVKPLHEARDFFCQGAFSSLLCLRDAPDDSASASSPAVSSSTSSSSSSSSSCTLLALHAEEAQAVTRAWRDTTAATATATATATERHAAAAALLARLRNTTEECGGLVYDDGALAQGEGQGRNLTLTAIQGTVWQKLLSHGGVGGGGGVGGAGAGTGGGAGGAGKRPAHRDHAVSLAQQLPQLQIQVLPQSAGAGLAAAPTHSLSLSGFLTALSRSLVDDSPTTTTTTTATSSNSSFQSSSGSGSGRSSGMVITPSARTLALLCLSERYLFARGLVEPVLYSVSEDSSSPLVPSTSSSTSASSPSLPVGFQETLHLLGVFSRVAPVTKSLSSAVTAATGAPPKKGGAGSPAGASGNTESSNSQSKNHSHSESPIQGQSQADIHRQFVSTGSGDNGGLRVLLVSADDRAMKDSLEEADYVGTMAVLTQRYAARHGYDYLQLAATSTVGLVDRVKRKYGAQLSAKGVGDNKRGPSAFHPGYKQYRASSWAKVPSVWHALTRFGDRYDYVWFFDSDATINPRLAHRSLSDALRVRTCENAAFYCSSLYLLYRVLADFF